MKVFSSLREILISNKISYFFDFFSAISKKSSDKLSRINIIQNSSKNFIEITLSVIILISFIYISSFQNLNFEESLPSIILLFVAFFRIVPLVNRILTQSQKILSNAIEAKITIKEFEYFEKKINKNKSTHISFSKLISLKNLHFKYGNKVILKNINLDIKKGEMIMFIGPSGSGKTTLLEIILGLLDPSKGRILIDKKEKLSSKSQRAFLKASYVPQNINLLDETLEKNITLSNNLTDIKNLNLAINKAGLNNYLKNSVKKLNTILGDSGSKLSGGQKQRVGLARAFYEKNEILILDEPTSMLDKKSEEVFFKTLMKYKKKMTIILVAHKPPVYLKPNHIYKVEDKKIKKIK